jgi:hypothetical protein
VCGCGRKRTSEGQGISFARNTYYVKTLATRPSAGPREENAQLSRAKKPLSGGSQSATPELQTAPQSRKEI